MKTFAPPSPRWDVELPNAFVYVGPYFVCLHDDDKKGEITIYCDGDVTLSPDVMQEMRNLLSQFLHERHSK